jgi:hypothetical protein
MENIKNFLVSETEWLNEKELLEYYDNPRNFLVKDCRYDNWENESETFPEHALVFLTHWTFFVNSKIRRTTQHTIKDFNRLIKNYSDFWTRKAIKKSWIPEENIITSPWSRALSDYNRENKTENEDATLPDGRKSIRPYDFNHVIIIDNPEQFREQWQHKTNMYHGSLEYWLNYAEEVSWWSIWIDIHDTWVNLMWKNQDEDKFREWAFPLITLWTKEWESCNSEILEYFSERLEHYLWIKSEINNPFQWWYVTTKHGLEDRKQKDVNNNPANKSIRNMIQVELGRFLYMKESTQEVDWERMEIIWEWLKRAIADTGIEFWEEYFRNLNK